MTPQSPAPVAAKTFSVGDYAVRLEDHPLVKAGEVHQVVEMFRGGYLGFAKPIGGEWNPKGWRKCDAEGWMPWSGGENPVPGQMVECKGRYDSFWGATASKDLRWIHIGKPSDIIAFRLSRPAPVADYEPCGGCGETNPSRRCLGCLHDFVSRPASEQPVEAIGAGREALEDAIERVDRWANYAYTYADTIAVNSPLSTFTAGDLRLILAALSPASPARTPMGGEVEALYDEQQFPDAEIRSAANLTMMLRRGGLEAEVINSLLERVQALAASSPSPAQGGEEAEKLTEIVSDADKLRIAVEALEVKINAPLTGPTHGAWDRGRIAGLKEALAALKAGGA